MKKIVIVGCGFGGLSASAKLAPYKKELEVTVIDQSEFFNFLPALPDIIGRGIDPGYLRYPINSLSKTYRFNFLKDEVISVSLQDKTVSTSTKSLEYDYLIISSGSETNFYGNETIRNNSLKLDDTFDAQKLKRELLNREFDDLVIAGGGYTGIEIATNARLFFDKRKVSKKITIIERAPVIIGGLPDWMRAYVLDNLRLMDIEFRVNTVIEHAEPGRLWLSTGIIMEQSLLIWAAGVRTSDFISDLKISKTGQGRVNVDEFLRANESVFVIGDAANFPYQDSFLRMAVQFALAQGKLAGQNILALIQHKPLRAFKPKDLGYLVPMANDRSCGIVLGTKVKGLLATFFHYFMCIYRTYSLRNKFGFTRELLNPPPG